MSAKNQVNLAALGPKICGEELHPLTLQILLRCMLPKLAESQVLCLRFASETCSELCHQNHPR